MTRRCPVTQRVPVAPDIRSLTERNTLRQALGHVSLTSSRAPLFACAESKKCLHLKT